MRKVFGMTLALAAVGLIATPAFAQQRGGFGMGGGAGMLWGNPSVQKELKFTEEQTEKVNAAIQEIRDKYQDQLADLRQQGPDGREKMMELTREMNAAYQKKVGELVKEEQLKRFKQISLQQQGVAAFADAEVAKALKLTDEQTSKIREINMASMQEMREAFQGAGQGGDRQAMMAKVQEIRKATNEKALAVLSAEQSKSYKEMLGTPFEIQFQPRQRGNN